MTISAHNFNIDILFVYLLLYGLMNFKLFKGKSVLRFYFTKKKCEETEDKNKFVIMFKKGCPVPFPQLSLNIGIICKCSYRFFRIDYYLSSMSEVIKEISRNHQ